ncbi:MAG: hypothetical protein IKY13_04925 [Bacteroidaceae bacterium]|nr:hypothetical protein [Bacteroidaceae bacterium]
MKKVILFFFISLIGLGNITAQTSNSLQTQDLNVSIDSLSTQLSSLQHDYDFLYCSHEVNLMQLEIRDLINNIDINSNAILINCYHGRFDVDLYTAYRDNYNSILELMNTLKEKTETIQVAVTLKTLTSDFSNEEIEVLMNSCKFLDKCLSKLQDSSDYYKVVLDIYKDLR